VDPATDARAAADSRLARVAAASGGAQLSHGPGAKLVHAVRRVTTPGALAPARDVDVPFVCPVYGADRRHRMSVGVRSVHCRPALQSDGAQVQWATAVEPGAVAQADGSSAQLKVGGKEQKFGAAGTMMRPAGHCPASSGLKTAPPIVWFSTHTLPAPQVAHVASASLPVVWLAPSSPASPASIVESLAVESRVAASVAPEPAPEPAMPEVVPEEPIPEPPPPIEPVPAPPSEACCCESGVPEEHAAISVAQPNRNQA
jgi:hypothetical protein